MPRPEPPDCLVTADRLLPVVGSALRNASLLIRRGRIAGIRGVPLDEPDTTEAITLGEFPAIDSSEARRLQRRDCPGAMLLPCPVNAHCHLDLSGYGGPPPDPSEPFTDWLARIVAFRRQPDYRPHEAVGRGLIECVHSGTVRLGDVAGSNTTPEAYAQAPGDVTAFFELIDPAAEQTGKMLEAVRTFVSRCPQQLRPGISPHAPYTVPLAVLRQTLALATELRLPVAMHLAETRAERELLATAAGPFRAMLERLELWRQEHRPECLAPMDYLKQLARAERALIIHGNYLDEAEIAFLAEHRDRMSLVCCPRTWRAFGHRNHPLPHLIAAGANVALGTDSRASAPDLDLVAEIRTAAEQWNLSAQTAWCLGTLAGATALGVADRTGSLEIGKDADLLVAALETDQQGDLSLQDSEACYAAAMSSARAIEAWYRGMPVWTKSPDESI